MSATRQYPGHAFHEGFTKGRASGQISISAHDVRFENASADVQLPLPGLTCQVGGASDRLIFFSHPDQPGWKLYTSDRAILKDPHLQQHAPLRAQLQQVRQRHIVNWGLLVTVALLIVLVPAILLSNLDRLSAPLARQIPPEWEQQLGEKAFEQYRRSGHFMAEDTANTLLQPLVQPLIDANPDQRFPYHFYISRDEEVNAFALPGGFVVINSALIIKAQTPEELLGVLAHEMAHVTEQHGIRNIMGSAGLYLTVNALLGDMTGLLAVLADAAPYLLNQRYSRGFETAADEKGVALLQQAGVDPQGLVQFFTQLKQEEDKRLQDMAGEDNQELAKATLSMISTHPATEDRIAHLQHLVQATPHGQPYRNLDDAFLHLQDAVKNFVTNSDPE